MAANWKLIDNYRYRTLDAVWLARFETMAAVIYTFAWSGLAGGKSVKGSGRGTLFRRSICCVTSTATAKAKAV